MSNEDSGKISLEVQESLRLIEDLKFFLATAPANWQENQVIRRYYLNHDEGFVSCVFWNNLYFITGTDIVRCIAYKFQHFGREIIDRKKFEEGIFSDLRNLKCGTDAILESPRSEFLEFLFKNSCLRTQKKQKVFFWFNVPHDKLMADALERDLKKEKLRQNSTTRCYREPAKSFKYDESKSLFNQLQSHLDIQYSNNLKNIDVLKDDQSSHTTPEYTSTTSTSPSTNLTTEVSSKPTTIAQDESERIQISDLPNSQSKNSENEEDFPLDYFDQEGNFNNEMEYINLDPNFYPAGYGGINDNYETIVDPNVFIQHTNSSSNQLIYNDDYLIEQAQPIKTPLLGLPNSALPPRSAKFMNFPLTLNEEYIPYQRPVSANYQSFPRHTPSQLYFPPQQLQPYYSQSSYQQLHDPYMIHEHDISMQNAMGYGAPGDTMLQFNPTFYEQELYPPYPIVIPVVPKLLTNKELPIATPIQPNLNTKKRPFTYKTTAAKSVPIDKISKSISSSLGETVIVKGNKKARLAR